MLIDEKDNAEALEKGWMYKTNDGRLLLSAKGREHAEKILTDAGFIIAEMSEKDWAWLSKQANRNFRPWWKFWGKA